MGLFTVKVTLACGHVVSVPRSFIAGGPSLSERRAAICASCKEKAAAEALEKARREIRLAAKAEELQRRSRERAQHAPAEPIEGATRVMDPAYQAMLLEAMRAEGYLSGTTPEMGTGSPCDPTPCDPGDDTGSW